MNLKYILFGYAGILLIIALISNPVGLVGVNIPEFIDINNVYHFSAYFVLGILAALTFKKSTNLIMKKNFFILTIFFVLIIASIDELLQIFTPDRIPDFLDIGYDFLGALCSQIFFLKLGGVQNKTSKKSSYSSSRT